MKEKGKTVIRKEVVLVVNDSYRMKIVRFM